MNQEKSPFESTVHEQDGEIGYPLTSPNKPTYPNYDEDRVPHDISPSDEVVVDNVVSIDTIPAQPGDKPLREQAKGRHPSASGRKTPHILRGESEGELHLITGATNEPYKPLTEEQKTVGLKGVAEARKALDPPKDE
jgi:hypothetical protein